jgi:hypothetical protein
MWTKFEEVVQDELQPVWVAVLLWQDVQIRLAVIRPTFPVQAFEAPGALGCESPASLVRRSDPTAGWEYAESNGRAIAIQRLRGYDSQKVSTPFLDQSNINLAYSYSEQPLIYESQASVAARCLASASLMRPMPFEPAQEFRGISVDVEYPEMFRVNLPDGRSALVAPGETTPKHAIINKLEVEGKQLRYVQVTQDLNEICGLNVTRIAGIASFSSPATARLKRASDSTIHLTTNTGVAFHDSWLPQGAHCIEAQTSDHQWVDVTDRCENNSIPSQVIEEWSERNQRTLIDFRITQ